MRLPVSSAIISRCKIGDIARAEQPCRRCAALDSLGVEAKGSEVYDRTASPPPNARRSLFHKADKEMEPGKDPDHDAPRPS